MKIAAIIFGLLAALCGWNAASDFRDAYTMRKYSAKVVGSKLKVDFGRTDSDSIEEPLYTILVDLVTTNEPISRFRWEGDPGQAVYPEEALDEFARFAPGTIHNISVVRGSPREVRMDSLESSLPLDKGIAWSSFTVFLAIVALTIYSARSWNKKGPWGLFVAIGLLPLLGAIPVGWFGYERLTTWEYISGTIVGAEKPFDPTQPLANVEFTAKALEKIPETSYQRFTFSWNANTYTGGYRGWHGPYDEKFAQQEPRFCISLKDRWATAATVEWGEDFLIPVGILMLFGVAFTGVGLLIRSSKI